MFGEQTFAQLRRGFRAGVQLLEWQGTLQLYRSIYMTSVYMCGGEIVVCVPFRPTSGELRIFAEEC